MTRDNLPIHQFEPSRSAAIRFFGLALLAVFCSARVALAALPAPEVPDGAFGQSVADEQGPRVSARLLVASDGVATNQPIRVGVLFDIQPGWHIYWRNPGDSALPTRIAWRIEEATVGELEWPAPEVFHEYQTGFTTYGYAEQVLLSTQITIHSRVDGPVRLAAEARFLACKEVCIPGSIDLERDLILGAVKSPDPRVQRLFDAYQARVPGPIEEHGVKVETLLSQSVVRPGDSFLFGVGVRACALPRDCDRDALQARNSAEIFIPYNQTNPSLRPLGVQGFPDAPSGFLLALRGHTEWDAPLRSEAPLRGILALPDQGYVEVALPFPTARREAEVELFATDWLDPDVLKRLPDFSIGLAYALGLALLGGLILNLMPCVLPILAIKIVSLSDLAHRERRQVAAHGLAYGVGIQASMGILTIAVLGLRQAGVGVGWGFQFREPVYLAAIAILIVLFAYNLFGLFEINLNTSRLDEIGRQSSGLRRSFFDGFLAVALATPCSAPFLGTAVGFAFSEGALEISSTFAAIGLGLALPFIAVSLAPGLSRFVPAAGPWMIRLRAGLGIALLITSGWLLWVLGRTAGPEAQLCVLILLIVIGLGAFGLGHLQRSHPGHPARLFAAGFAGLILVTLALLPLQPQRVALDEASDSAIPWRAFDPIAIAAELQDRRPVFVYFTADWCITCKVNERLVLRDEAVIDALKRLDVATFRGDWTLRDEAIRLELARHGKAGVPVYLVYGPDRPEGPNVLPELITVDVMLKALERAAPRGSI